MLLHISSNRHRTPTTVAAAVIWVLSAQRTTKRTLNLGRAAACFVLPTNNLLSHRHLDLNGDGSISLAEMAALMGELGVDAGGVDGGGTGAAAELMAAVSEADLCADGGIDFPAFLSFCRRVRARPRL